MKDPKSADAAGGFGSHGILQNGLGHQRGDIAPQAMLFARRLAIDHIITFGQFVEQVFDSRRRMLQVIVHCDDHLKMGGANAA